MLFLVKRCVECNLCPAVIHLRVSARLYSLVFSFGETRLSPFSSQMCLLRYPGARYQEPGREIQELNIVRP
jgi:hypothetical protein